MLLAFMTMLESMLATISSVLLQVTKDVVDGLCLLLARFLRSSEGVVKRLEAGAWIKMRFVKRHWHFRQARRQDI